MKHLLASLLVVLSLIACETAGNNTPPNPSNDKEAPVITLAASEVEFHSPGTLTLTATATDNVAVSKVEFYEEDVSVTNPSRPRDLQAAGLQTSELEPLAENKISEDSEAPYTFEIPVETGENIVRTFRAKALDEAGNIGSSVAITVAVNIRLGSLQVYALRPDNMELEGVTIRVTGPNGFEASVSGTEEDSELRDLEFGTYTITPNAAIGVHPVVNARVKAEVQTITLSPSRPADFVGVDYEPRPDTGKLWLAVRNENKLVAFGNFSGSANPTIALGTGTGSGADSVAFDKGGNLWMVARDSKKLLMFTPEQLAVSGTPTATVTIDGAGFMESPRGLAFDKDNNLWIADFTLDTVFRYTANELASSGAPTPDVLTSPDLDGSSGLAFDAAGDLWVANRHLGVVSKFQLEDLTTFTNVTAKVKLIAATAYGLAIDKDGNIWVSNSDRGSLMRFPAPQLNNETVAPDITLSSNNNSLATPTGLGFDNSGNLYVTNFATETLAIFEPSDLVATGSPEARLLTGIGDTGSGFFAFNLPPKALPLAR